MEFWCCCDSIFSLIKQREKNPWFDFARETVLVLLSRKGYYVY